MFEWFVEYGWIFNNGVICLVLLEEDCLVWDYFCLCCCDFGMDIKIDDFGCIYVMFEGVEDKLFVVIGLYMDSVKKGGRFDGIFGVVVGLELVRMLVEYNIKLKVLIMIVNFMNEEGVCFEFFMMVLGILLGKF